MRSAELPANLVSDPAGVSSPGQVENPPWLAFVAEKVGSLHYGVVQIVVHDSQVVQVERTERHRFEVSKRA